MPGPNPFMSIVEGYGQGIGQPTQPEPAAPQGAPAKPGMQPGGEEVYQEPDQMQPGQNPDSTKFLLSAIQAVENFIKKTDDREDLVVGRQIVSLLSRLIAKDQSKYASKL